LGPFSSSPGHLGLVVVAAAVVGGGGGRVLTCRDGGRGDGHGGCSRGGGHLSSSRFFVRLLVVT
jgi:hypothetical protein